MPLSRPSSRQHIHTRRIECRGYKRSDGLWDVEGHLVDTKTYTFPTESRGELVAGEPIHDMWLRLTIDDEFLIHAAEAATDFGPYEGCPGGTPNFAKLAGIKIGPGWMRAVAEQVGGSAGCTHLFEMLRPLATVCYQTIVGDRIRETDLSAKRPWKKGSKPRHINSCYMYRDDGPLVKRFWPEYYTGTE